MRGIININNMKHLFSNYKSYLILSLIILILGMLLFPPVSSAETIAQTIDIQVSARADDGANYTGTWGFTNSGDKIYIGYTSTSTRLSCNTFYRFTGISGLEGATITAAYIQLSAHSAYSGTPHSALYAADEASPAAPTNASGYNAIPLTSASVDWTFSTPGASDPNFQTSPDLTAIIQELADSYDPSVIMIVQHNTVGSGNAYQSYHAYEELKSRAPRLHIEYTIETGPDTTPPVRSNSYPSGTLAAGTTQTTLSLTTDEPATCRYSTTANTDYSSMADTFSVTGDTSHTTLVTGLADGNAYTYYVKCQDTAGNPNTDDLTISFSIAMPDTTPPVISSVSDSNITAFSAVINWVTDEPADSQVEYGLTEALGLSSDLETNYVTDHSVTLTNLNSDTTYYYRVKSNDPSNNLAISDLFSFTVAQPSDNSAIIVDHTSTDITKIPESAILAAKENLHIGYGHLSHGSQLTRGMTGLVAFANNGGKGLSLPTDIFAWNNGGTDGALDLEDGNNGDTSLSSTCSYSEYDYWPQTTRDFLDSHPDVNVFMWSWCYEIDSDYREGILQNYLDTMNQLEVEYANKPGRAPVKFVYMTGTLGLPHSDDHYASRDDADIKAANAMVRNYCIADNKTLYDFGDIERFDPDGNYYEFADEECNYYSSATDSSADGNWAQAWRASHTLNVDWFNGDGSAPHTDQLNGNLKAYAAWWLWARLAGWDGGATTTNHAPALDSIGNKSINEELNLNFTVSATDQDGDALAYSASNLPLGATFDPLTGLFSWTPTDAQSGTYPNVCFAVSDGSLSDQEFVTIKVNNVCYVSTDGNDNNPGTFSQPWRHINYAAGQAQPGDTVYVRGGTYNEQVVIGSDGNANNWINFRNYSAETPIIDGSSLNLSGYGLVRMGGANYIVFDGFQVANSENFGIFIFQSDHIIVQNCAIYQSGLFSFGVDGSSAVWFAA